MEDRLDCGSAKDAFGLSACEYGARVSVDGGRLLRVNPLYLEVGVG